MWLGKYLSSLTRPELEFLKDQLNLTDEEAIVFEQLSKGRSKIAAADKCMVSISTIDNRIRSINSKVSRVNR